MGTAYVFMSMNKIESFFDETGGKDPLLIYLLSYYLANKRSLHVRSQSLEITTLNKKK